MTHDHISVPVKLDNLDDNSATFRGTDEVTMSHHLGPFGVIEAEVGWPAVMIPREAWEMLGCPTMLMFNLTLVEVPD